MAIMATRIGAASWRWAVVPMAALLASCGSSGSTTPTSPTGTNPSDVLALEVECQSTLYIGEQAPCLAVTRLRSGGTALVSMTDSASVTWSSQRPEVAGVSSIGLVTGRGAGQTMVRAEYQGRSAQYPVSVVAADALRVTAATERGPFTPGNVVMMYLQGYYSVASAETGRLSLRISDQRGTVTQTTATTVSRGGDFFALSATFTVPDESTRLCRAVVLQVSDLTVAAPEPGSNNLACVDVRR
jgi:hypothetical protein